MWIRLPILIALAAVGTLRWSSSRTAAPKLGISDERLLECPDSPNCVCSFDQDPAHAIAPFTFTGPSAEALGRLKAAALSMSRTRLVEETPSYLRIEFTTLVFGFRDDVEFLVDDKASVIHVRSASRVGYSDLGLNRRRVEAVRAKFNQR